MKKDSLVKNNLPLVSVIMSVYNPKDYGILLKSVRSILCQTYKNFEFIICNDGSSNIEAKEYLHKVAQLDCRIKIISYKKNHGLAYSRNICLKEAKGKYIAFQDDDDISEPLRLEKEVEFLNNNLQYAFVGTNAYVFDKDGVWGEFTNPKSPNKKDFLWGSPFLNPSMMFRSTVLKQIGGFRVSKETQRAEDYDLFFRLYARGYRGFNIQDKLFNYRIEIENEKNKKYRPMKDRLNEAKVRAKGFKALHMSVVGIPFVLKPIMIGLIPHQIFYKIRKRQY